MSDKDRQMSFEFAGRKETASRDEDELDVHGKRIAGHLTVRLPEPVDVVFTNNRSTMVSFKRRGGRLKVRLHRLFRLADGELLDSLALYIGKKDKHASLTIDEFIQKNKDEIEPADKKRKQKLVPEGKHYDLSKVLKNLSDTYFNGQVNLDIGWARAPAKRKRRRTRSISRALATYSFDDKTIRVSPVLDAADVPKFIIDWVVYHEMLHHVIPVEESQGRKRYHTERFKNLEKAFEKYEDARKWEKANIDRLLS